MMPLHPPVVRENLAGREQKRGSAKRPVSSIPQQHRRQPDAIPAKPFSQIGVNAERGRGAEFLRRDQKMLSPRLQLLDLGEHPLSSLAIAGSERHYNRIRIFPENSKYEFLERGPQRKSISVTSPAVLSLASGLPSYSTCTRRAPDCGPQPNVLSPLPPVSEIPFGSRIRSCTVLPSSVFTSMRACCPRQSSRTNTPSTPGLFFSSSIGTAFFGTVPPSAFIFLRAASSAA